MKSVRHRDAQTCCTSCNPRALCSQTRSPLTRVSIGTSGRCPTRASDGTSKSRKSAARNRKRLRSRRRSSWRVSKNWTQKKPPLWRMWQTSKCKQGKRVRNFYGVAGAASLTWSTIQFRLLPTSVSTRLHLRHSPWWRSSSRCVRTYRQCPRKTDRAVTGSARTTGAFGTCEDCRRRHQGIEVVRVQTYTLIVALPSRIWIGCSVT